MDENKWCAKKVCKPTVFDLSMNARLPVATLAPDGVRFIAAMRADAQSVPDAAYVTQLVSADAVDAPLTRSRRVARSAVGVTRSATSMLAS